MLTSIRERAQGWIAWIIIGLIILVFAVWGIQSFFTPNPNVPVITVNNAEIGLRDFQVTYQQQRERLRSMLGESMEQSGFTDERVKQQVIEEMIEQVLLTDFAESLGMRIGDVQLAAEIQAIEAFRIEGRFSKERYEQLLRNQGMIPARFERQTRTTLLNQQLRNSVVQSSVVTPTEVDAHLKRIHQKRDVAYLTVPVVLEGITISEEDLQHYFREHAESYQVPEQVSIAYLDLSAEELAPQVEVTEEALQNLYTETRANYRQEERRKARHILLTVDAKADAATTAMVRTKIEDLRKQIVEGASFEDLAKAQSQDPGSAAHGGDLGFFGRGAMVKPFEESVFSLKEGEVSEPIQTAFGFHLIQVTGIEPVHEKTFEEARATLTQEYRRSQAEKLFFERAETLTNLTYEHPESLEAAAQALGIMVQAAGPFSRIGGLGIVGEKKVVSAAFSEDVLSRGNNSEAVDLPGNRVVVLRVTDHQVSRPQTLGEVREQVTFAAQKERAEVQTKKQGEDLLQELRSGKEPTTVLEASKVSWKKSGWLERQGGSSVPQALVFEAFRLARPVEGKPIYAGLVLDNGEFGIIQVDGVQDSDPSKVSAADRIEARRSLTRALGQQNFSDLLARLKTQAKIHVYRERF